MTPFDDFDGYVAAAMASWHCPGAAVTVIKDDKVLYQGAHGLRDAEADLPLTLTTRFPLASVTKSFTAMCVALLVDEGKLEWDTPVRDYAPEFILADDYATRHLTMRDLLSHRTGLPGHFLATYRLDITPTELVKRMRYLKFNTSFRGGWQYNNTVYSAVAYLIEKLSGQRWQDFMQERIFIPLGMTASNFSPEFSAEGRTIAEGYRVERDQKGAFIAVQHLPFGAYTDVSPGTAGGLFSNLADLTTWLELHLSEGKTNGVKLVSPENLKQMHLPQMVIPVDEAGERELGTTISSYGMGWFVEPYQGRTLVSHAGGVEGHTVWAGFIPEEKVAVVVLTNLANNSLTDVLLREGLDRALGLKHEDWNAKLHRSTDPTHAEWAESRKKEAESRISDAPMSHPPKDYMGTYEAEGYPVFAVKLEGDTLQACTIGSLGWGEVRHYHYDTFEWHVSELDFWLKFRFLMGEDGEIDSVSLPLEPTVGDIVFKRKLADDSKPETA